MSMKLRSPDFVNRLRVGMKEGIGTLLALETLTGLVLGGGLIKANSVPGLAIVVGAVFVSLGVAYVRGRQHALPQWVCDELSGESKYSCRPCSPEDLKEASKIVQPIFGRDNVDHSVLEQWRLKSPKGFMEITNDENVLVGCFVVIGLEPSFMDQFKQGTVSEGLITGQRVLPMSETKRIKDIHISGVMVRDPGGYLASKRTRVLIWCMLKYLRHHFGSSWNKTLYAVALNKDSEKLLRSLEFSLYSQASGRI